MYDLYVQSDTLLLTDMFETFLPNTLRYINLVLLSFMRTKISMASVLKKDRNKIRIIN